MVDLLFPSSLPGRNSSILGLKGKAVEVSQRIFIILHPQVIVAFRVESAFVALVIAESTRQPAPGVFFIRGQLFEPGFSRPLQVV